MRQVGQSGQVPGAGVVPADVGEDAGAARGGLGDPGGADTGREEATAARARGGQSGDGSSGGGSWPWETIVRSPSYAIETVTGECQPGTVRDGDRSMPSPWASASQQ